MGLVAVVGTIALAGCGTSSASFRYRMRVEGTYTGTAVYEMLAERTSGPRLADEKPGGSLIKGEALVVETPSGPVFVLLQSAAGGGDLIGAVTRALAPDIPWNGQPNFWKAVTRLEGAGTGSAKGDLPRTEWPMMVRFGDINDAKSVERVDPDAIGVKRIALETTRDSVTVGIERKFPTWFQKLARSGARLDGDSSIAVSANPSSLAGHFSPGDFSTTYDGGR